MRKKVCTKMVPKNLSREQNRWLVTHFNRYFQTGGKNAKFVKKGDSNR
jgi:hypothetical protein